MKRGFTLLEMSIVLAIISTVIGGMLAVIPGLIQALETEETQARQQAIQQALYDFRLAFNRIPCPADVTQAVDLNTANSNYFGIEAANPGTCTGGTPAANFSANAASSGVSASFVKTDTATEGSWNGVYGSNGYVIEGSTNSPPSYASLSFTGNTTYTWNGSTSDGRALETSNPGNTSTRIASCWDSSSNFSITVNITDGNLHQVALYLLDWDGYGGGRTETVTVKNTSTGAVLDGPRAASSFGTGQWWVWNISGDVTFLITNTNGGSNATVSGVFFSGSSSPIVEGMVPTKTLALPDDDAFDGWGRRMMYAVAAPFTASGAFASISANDTTTRMTVLDASDNAKTTMAAYVLVSFGDNGHGAFPRGTATSNLDVSASRLFTGSDNTDEWKNCDCNATTYNGSMGGVFVQKMGTQNPSDSLNTFDDLVVFETRSGHYLRSPTE